MQRRELIWQLKKHGHSQDSLDKMTTNELQILFKKESKAFLTGFLESTKEDIGFEISVDNNENTKEQLDKIREAFVGEEIDYNVIYDTIEKLFDDFGINETIELVLTQTNDKHYKTLTQIVEISYRAYQEILLDKIEKLCEFYPIQERLEQVKFYSDRRDNVNFLKKTIETMQHNQKNLSTIAQLKFEIIKNYYPDSMNENYEEFFEDIEQKNEVIERIMSLTGAYKRQQLKAKKLEALRNIEKVLVEDSQKEKEEKNYIKQFIRQVSEVMVSDDEFAFARIIQDALDVLEERDVRKVLADFEISSNPIFLQRFNAIIKDHRPKG
ncbi:MAG: hypothetical protein J1E31_00955 [Helicobacter sp.]|nr:hypothetical protein [Helicobacter sp.]